jgi:hypothetical protein
MKLTTEGVRGQSPPAVENEEVDTSASQMLPVFMFVMVQLRISECNWFFFSLVNKST